MSGDAAAAEAEFRRAETLMDEALAARPGTTEYVASRCDLLVNWGNLDVANGRLEAGIDRFGRGLRDLTPVLDAEPNIRRLKLTAINLHGARALALEKVGRYREAAADWNRVIALSDPGPVALGYAVNRLLCLARDGDHRAVMTEADSLEARADLSAIDRYNLACALALASAAAPEHLPLRARALKAIERAFANDPRLRETARQDADLQSIAGDPTFRRALDGRWSAREHNPAAMRARLDPGWGFLKHLSRNKTARPEPPRRSDLSDGREPAADGAGTGHGPTRPGGRYRCDHRSRPGTRDRRHRGLHPAGQPDESGRRRWPQGPVLRGDYGA